MSTRLDILNARKRLSEHVGTHGCKLGDGCPIRLNLFRQWNRLAGLWAQEPDDAERQRLQSQIKE
jgi:hypothetical protein